MRRDKIPISLMKYLLCGKFGTVLGTRHFSVVHNWRLLKDHYVQLYFSWYNVKYISKILEMLRHT